MPRIPNASTLASRQTPAPIPHKEPAGAAPNNSPFLKQLASSSSLTRGKALEHLRQYLRTRTSLTTLDQLKLWKGLFYCVWHSDRPRAQQALARDLASLVHTVPGHEATAGWLESFWETMAREWGGIPSLRMDKFLYLCRLYVKAGFEWCKRTGWSADTLERMTEIVQACPLSSEVERPAMTNGLRFHILDVWVDEIEAVKGDGEGEDEGFPLDALLAPVQRLKKATRDKAVRKRAQEALDDPRIREWRGEEQQETATDE